MMQTRRTFLKSSACTMVALGSAPRFLVRTAEAAPGRRKVLLAVFQRGAVDGLSMVIPYGDPGYAPVRPRISLAPPPRGESQRGLDLDGFFALHPALAPLKSLWEAGALAVVHACGSPSATRSHFDAQDYMETGTPGVKTTPDGWLARALGGLPVARSPLRAVALGSTLPRVLGGGVGAVAMQSIAEFDIEPGAPESTAQGAFRSLYGGGTGDSLQGTGRAAFEAVRALKQAGAARIPTANGAEYPVGRFGESLRQIAQLIKADVGVEVAFADVAGWDTHVAQGNEEGQLANRFREFGAGLAAFGRDLGDDALADVVVLTMSEFGRTVAENGSGGTDHGHATAMLVMGGGVRGGKVYGQWPGLERDRLFEARDLAVTTDFRALFREVAISHLRLSPAAALFPGWVPTGPSLGLFA